MNKNDLIASVASSAGLSKSDATRAIESFLDSITNALKSAENKNYKYFIVDAALLFEANFQHFFDYIILVTADKEIRLKRAIKRKNIDLSQIKKRMALQLSDNEKIDKANFVIENNLDIQNLKKEFNQVFKKII